MLRYRPKHKSFDYKPRFYDQEKEELMERLAKYDREGKSKDIEVSKDNIRASFRSSSGKPNADLGYRAKMVNQSNKRLIAIIIILCAVLYLLVQSQSVLDLIG